MTREEIKKIIEKGWAERRLKQEKRSERNSERTRKWKERERQLTVEENNLKRWKHYLNIPEKNK